MPDGDPTTGEQPGDGSPEIDRSDATAQISAAAVDLMDGLAASGWPTTGPPTDRVLTETSTSGSSSKDVRGVSFRPVESLRAGSVGTVCRASRSRILEVDETRRRPESLAEPRGGLPQLVGSDDPHRHVPP